MSVETSPQTLAKKPATARTHSRPGSLLLRRSSRMTLPYFTLLCRAAVADAIYLDAVFGV